MKQLLFITFLLLIPFVSKGQTKHKPIGYQVIITTGFPMSTPSTVPLLLEGKAFYSFSTRFAAGVGTGFSLYDKEVLIPLTANLYFNLLTPARFTPYLDCGIGYSFAPSGKVCGGFYLSPSAGVRMKIFSDKKLLIALGYGSQGLKRLREYSTPQFVSSYEESLSFCSLSVKLGFAF